jgi:hypothetical protein
LALRIATTSGVGVEEAAARALHTIRQVMPARLRHRVDTRGGRWYLVARDLDRDDWLRPA